MASHQWELTYTELLNTVNVPRLQERRLHLKLAQVYKIVHGLCYFPADIFQLHPSYSDRLTRTDTVHCPFARTNYYIYTMTFVPSNIRSWNLLEKKQVSAERLVSFRKSLIWFSILLPFLVMLSSGCFMTYPLVVTVTVIVRLVLYLLLLTCFTLFLSWVYTQLALYSYCISCTVYEHL